MQVGLVPGTYIECKSPTNSETLTPQRATCYGCTVKCVSTRHTIIPVHFTSGSFFAVLGSEGPISFSHKGGNG